MLLSLQVSVVGVVRGFVPFATNVQYSVDDMTGPPLNVKQWINTEACGFKKLISELYGKQMSTANCFFDR